MKVCFLGLGSMGSGVCRNLLNKGYALQVWNRSPEKAAKVAGWGAEAFATPQEAARGAGVVMSCLSSVAALKAVAGGANGVLSCMGKGMAFYDMGTWDIESVLALEAEAGEHADAHQKIAQHAPEEEQIPGGGQLARDDQGQIGPQQLPAGAGAGQQQAEHQNAQEIAQVIQPQFKETSLEQLTRIVERYKKQDTWKEDTVFQKESFDLLQNILEEAGELKKRVPYEELVTTDFSLKAKNPSVF